MAFFNHQGNKHQHHHNTLPSCFSLFPLVVQQLHFELNKSITSHLNVHKKFYHWTILKLGPCSSNLSWVKCGSNNDEKAWDGIRGARSKKKIISFVPKSILLIWNERNRRVSENSSCLLMPQGIIVCRKVFPSKMELILLTFLIAREICKFCIICKFYIQFSATK